MSHISINKIQTVLPEFVNLRLMPNAPDMVKWILGGATYTFLKNSDAVIGNYLPLGKTLGIINNNNQIDINVARNFFEGAFKTCENISFMNFKFSKADSDALIDIMENYRDDQ